MSKRSYTTSRRNDQSSTGHGVSAYQEVRARKLSDEPSGHGMSKGDNTIFSELTNLPKDLECRLIEMFIP